MWKLKVDDKGVPVLDANGNYIYIKPDGTDYIADIAQMVGKIADLGREAADHRKRGDTAEATLKKFTDAGVTDPEAAKTALATVKNIKDGDLISAGKVEEVRREITASVQGKLDAAETATKELKSRLNNTLLDNAFKSSPFVKDKLILPADLARSSFASHFEVTDDGKIKAKDAKGNQIYSIKRAGEDADFDEAIEILVSNRTDKNALLKGANNRGSGNEGGGAGNGGGKRTILRTEWDKQAIDNPAKTAADALAIRKGELIIVDGEGAGAS